MSGLSRVLFSSASNHWATPRAVYDALNAEFRFTLDPCPLDDSATAGASLWGKDGLTRLWAGERVFCNPPYSDIGPWVAKALEASLSVYLVPARTDTKWWHRYVVDRATEIRFLRGRLRFGDAKAGAPFPSVVLVYDHNQRKDAPCDSTS